MLEVLALFLSAAAMPPMAATPSGAGQPVRDSNLTQAAGECKTWWREEQIRRRAARQASWAPRARRDPVEAATKERMDRDAPSEWRDTSDMLVQTAPL